MIDVVSFVVGIAGLVLGGHLVVDGASKLGARAGLTPTVIGLTIVAAGTSAPELAVVLQALGRDDAPLAIGSIIGSNIANVLLVLGLVAAIGAIRVTSRIVWVDIPIMIAASVGLLVLSLDHQLGRTDGLVLLAALIGFVIWTLRTAPRAAPERAQTPSPATGAGTPASSDAAAPTAMATGAPADRGTPTGVDVRSRTWFRAVAQAASLLAGVGALAVAARFVVAGAEGIASTLGVPELIVGLTIVALGTSAPEIVTSIIAAVRGQRDLAVGNAVGSNIFNILLVLGASSAIAGGIPISADALELDLPIMVVTAIACLPIVFWDHTLDRWEGGVFVAYYLAYLVFLVLDGTGHRASDPFAFVMVSFVAPLTLLTIIVFGIRKRAARPGSAAEQPPPGPGRPTRARRKVSS